MIKISQGDYAVLNFTAQTGDGAVFDLSGATFESKLMGSDNALDTFATAKHTIVSASLGTFTLTLTETETAALKVGTREITTKVTQGGHDRIFHGTMVVLAGTPEN